MAETHTDAADRYWEALGNENPYWGVSTSDGFQKGRVTESTVEELYATGETHVHFVFGVIRKHLDEDFAPAAALDFGCGVGRLVVPLARRCQAVVGVDVSEGMLRRAQARCDLLGLSNVRLVRDAGQLVGVTELFDLIHCYIVLQHIPCPRGEAIVEQLLHRLRDGGVGALHLTYFNESRSRLPRLRRLMERLRLYSLACAVRGLGRRLLRVVTGGAWRAPKMQMNPYNLNAILLTLQRAGVRRLHLEYTDHEGCYGVMLFFQKRRDDRYLA